MGRSHNRRTKEDFKKNDIVLQKLFEKHSNGINIAYGITREELREFGYIGSLPYSSPTCTEHYAIRQVESLNGYCIYSIFKMK